MPGTSQPQPQQPQSQESRGGVNSMRAILGAMQSRHVGNKNYTNIVDQDLTIDENSGVTSHTHVFFENCSNVRITLNTMSMKINVMRCTNISININSKILAHSLDIYQSNQVRVNSVVPIGTAQLDQSNDILLSLSEKSLLTHAVWVRCSQVVIELKDVGLTHSTGLETLENTETVTDTTQFKVHFVNDILTTERVVRLPNGFVTTQREADEWDARQARNSERMAAMLNVRITPGPNATATATNRDATNPESETQ